MKLLKYLWNNGDKFWSIFFFYVGVLIFIFSKNNFYIQVGLSLALISLWIKLDLILEKKIIVKNNFINHNDKFTISENLEAKSYDDLFCENQALRKELEKK
jgi:hypothetical protein